MYQIDIFDKYGAIVARFTFKLLIDAIEWMVNHSTGKIISRMGTVIKAPVEWQLSRVDMKMHHKLLNITKQPSAPESNSQARRLAHQRKIR